MGSSKDWRPAGLSVDVHDQEISDGIAAVLKADAGALEARLQRIEATLERILAGDLN